MVFCGLKYFNLCGCTATRTNSCSTPRIVVFHVAAGFQKNFPFPDNTLLEARIGEAYAVCKTFGVSMGFHSGSGKSAENYGVCGPSSPNPRQY